MSARSDEYMRGLFKAMGKVFLFLLGVIASSVVCEKIVRFYKKIGLIPQSVSFSWYDAFFWLFIFGFLLHIIIPTIKSIKEKKEKKIREENERIASINNKIALEEWEKRKRGDKQAIEDWYKKHPIKENDEINK